MSRASILGTALLGGLVGAVLGAGAMLLVRPEPQGAATPPLTEERLAAALEDALSPLVDELRRERRAGRHTPRSMDSNSDRGTGTERTSAPPPDPTPPSAEVVVGGTRGLPDPVPAEPLRPEGHDWTPEPRFEAVERLRGFNADMAVRQRWLFLGEHEALRRFGTPHEVHGAGVEENWVYKRTRIDEDGEEVVDAVTLRFSRGRLVQAWD